MKSNSKLTTTKNKQKNIVISKRKDVEVKFKDDETDLVALAYTYKQQEV